MPHKRVSDETIVAYLGDYWKKFDYGPSMREIGAAVGLSGQSSVRARLMTLHHKGLVSAHFYPDGPQAWRALARSWRPAPQTPR